MSSPLVRFLPADIQRVDQVSASLPPHIVELVDWLKGQNDRIENGKCIPLDVYERLVEADLFRLTLPPRLGGQGKTPADVWPVVMELAKAVPSVAWVLSLCLANTVLMARLPDRLQKELYGSGNPVAVAAITGPPAQNLTVEKTEDGVMLSGKWIYASGVDIANWVAIILPADADKPAMFTLIPKSEFVIDHNSWTVMGMRGTGSKDITLSNVFVPEKRMVDWTWLQSGVPHPECTFRDDELSHYPLNPLFAMSILAPTLGLSCAIAEAFRDAAQKKADRANSQWREPFMSADLARGAAELQLACDAMITEAARPIFEQWALDTTTIEDRAGMRVRLAVVADNVRHVCQHLINMSGGQIVPEGSPLSRLMRDFVCMHSHFLLQLNPSSESYGRVILGADTLPGTRF